MIDKREVKRFGLKFGKYLDPLGLFLLIALFVLPIFAVINLSPKTKAEVNVLGAQSQKSISVVLVGGTHDFLKVEKLEFPSDGKYTYKAQMLKHEAGKYSKPILQISNTTEKDIVVNVTGGTSNPTGSSFSILTNEKAFLIQDNTGVQNMVEIKIPKQSQRILFLQFDTQTPIMFSENIEITITQ